MKNNLLNLGESMFFFCGVHKTLYFCACFCKLFKIMVNRRLLRVKVLQVFYAFTKKGNDSVNAAEKELLFSIEKSWELFYFLLYLLIDLGDYAASRIEISRNKKIATHEDLHPNMRFVQNLFIEELRKDSEFQKIVQGRKINWVQYPELSKKLFQTIIDSEDYLNYMASGKNSFDEDKAFITVLFSKYIAGLEDLDQALEERSIYWNDDLIFATEMILKSIKKSKPGKLDLPDHVFKNEEDKQFAIRLLRKSILSMDQYRDLIDTYVENWDVERIAMMDVLIMILAINEMVEFPEIPVKVSLNEYIEISKLYSSNKSGLFINGILDKITSQLRKDKIIIKKGRGLMGEI